LRAELDQLNGELEKTQGENPLIQVCVDVNAISEIVSNWTGIPVGRMVSDEIQTILNLKQKMEERVVGQSHGLEQIAQAIRTSRAKLTDPRRPIGVFMLAGPSGVGKTETALCLADLLYGGEQNMTVINMSEYKEEHKVSLLMGSPPGYVGFGVGGVLTEGVRRKPYSVVLLDELDPEPAGDGAWKSDGSGHSRKPGCTLSPNVASRPGQVEGGPGRRWASPMLSFRQPNSPFG
jgi:type VI secretion system protein VasG